jgi:hypothetical protein
MWFVGDHILQEFYTLYLTRFRTYKIVSVPRRLFFAAPQRIAITLSPNYYQKNQRFTTRRTWPRCHVSLEKSSKNYKPLKKMSQTKPHPSVPPPPAKSDGEYFPQVFHVVIPDPPNSPAVLTRRSGWQKSGGRAG